MGKNLVASLTAMLVLCLALLAALLLMGLEPKHRVSEWVYVDGGIVDFSSKIDMDGHPLAFTVSFKPESDKPPRSHHPKPPTFPIETGRYYEVGMVRGYLEIR